MKLLIRPAAQEGEMISTCTAAVTIALVFSAKL